jgi:hypothetical protein
MPRHKLYEFRDRAERLYQMARETTDERARHALKHLADENLAKADEAEASASADAQRERRDPLD